MMEHPNSFINIRLVRSKLRKRDETSLATTQSGIEAQQTYIPAVRSSNFGVSWSNNSKTQEMRSPQDSCNTNDFTNKTHVGFVRTSGVNPAEANNWVFPPKAPTPNLYHCYKTDALESMNEKHGFKGFRKQFSGRFKRLVKKTEPVPAIPPELKPQLKTIYVY